MRAAALTALSGVDAATSENRGVNEAEEVGWGDVDRSGRSST